MSIIAFDEDRRNAEAVRRLKAAAPIPASPPPHNIEAEQALLGAILINNSVYQRIAELIDASHFYDPLHGQVFEAAAGLIEAGRLANPVTMQSLFVDAPDVGEHLTVPEYLGRLAAHAPSISGAKDYACLIRDLATRRALMSIGQQMDEAASSPDNSDPSTIIEGAESALYDLAESNVYGKGSRSLSTVLQSVVTDASAAYEARGNPHGLKTGFHDLDAKISINRGNLVIIAGRPSMGKTALALNIATNIARVVPVQFDSLEMTADELALRLLAERSEISSMRIRNGEVHEDDFRTVVQAGRDLADLPLWIEDAGGLTIGRLAARARRMKRQRGIGCLFVDYIQLMAGNGNNRVADVTDITTGLKALAKDLDIPIIALSQLSRKVEERADKRPQLADLRDSGSIEQDADIVMFVYRDEYYIERTKPDENDFDAYSKWSAKLASSSGKAEVIIAKQRHGHCGTINMQFDAARTRFSDLARDEPASRWQS